MGRTHPVHHLEPLTDKGVALHLSGKGPAVGVCPIWPGERATQCAVLDLDAHKGEVAWPAMVATAKRIMAELAKHGLHAVPFRSRGGGGVHLILLWKAKQDAYSVRTLLRDVLGNLDMTSGTGGVLRNQVEIFPKQDHVPEHGAGSMFILPLAGKSEALDPDTMDTIKAADIKWLGSDAVPAVEKPPRESVPIGDVDLDMLRGALEAIPNADVDELDYEPWRNVVFAIHHATEGSEEGRELAHAFSQKSGKYSAEFLDTRVWPYVRTDRDNAITEQTIYRMAQTYGWQDPGVIEAFDVVEPAPGVGDRFELLPVLDYARSKPRPRWLIDGVLPEAELGVVYGESGSGKTFLAFDIAAAVCQGTDWRNLNVVQKNVAYVCAEGLSGFLQRAEAYAQHHKLRDLKNFFVIKDAPNLLLVDDVKALIGKLTASPVGIGLVIVDTLAQVMPGANENASEDMGKAVYHCKQIHRATGAMVVLVHHSGKDAAKGARGHTSLRAAADMELEVSRRGDQRQARVTKMKDGDDGAVFRFSLSKVSLGYQGNTEITSCIVTHESGPAKPTAGKPQAARLGVIEELILEAVQAREDMAGDAVAVAEVIDAVVPQIPHDGEAKRDPRRHNTMRAITRLQGKKLITVDGGRVRVSG
jgi:hypothetical protein